MSLTTEPLHLEGYSYTDHLLHYFQYLSVEIYLIATHRWSRRTQFPNESRSSRRTLIIEVYASEKMNGDRGGVVRTYSVS